MKKIIFLFFFGALIIGGYAQSSYWNLSGNANTTPFHFLGTTDNNPIIFKIGNIERMRLTPVKNTSFLGIGLTNPQAPLHLHYQPIPVAGLTLPIPEGSTDDRVSDIKLLQLSTSATGSGANNGFSISLIDKDIVFEQHERAKFFIEGPGGGLMISPDGNIGIGTDIPRQKLHIENGNLLISKALPNASASMNFEIANSINKWRVEYQNSVNGNGLNFVNITNPNSNSVLFLANDNKVGIGTTAPQTILHLHDPRNMSPTSMESSLPEDSTRNERSFRNLLRLTTRDTQSGGFVISSEWSHLYFQHREQGTFSIAGPGGGVSIAPNGYIGMGTDIPRQKLHVVDGNILISRTSRAPGSKNGSIAFGGDITNTHNGSWGIEYLNSNEEGYGLNFWKAYNPGENHFNYALFLRDDGNVGVGKKDPQAKLDVGGSFRAENANIDTVSTKILTAQRASIDTIFIEDLTAQDANITGTLTTKKLNAGDTISTKVLNAERANISKIVTTKELSTEWADIAGTMFNQDVVTVGPLVMTGSLYADLVQATCARISGTVCAKEVQVSLNPSCWPDFVFEKDYELLPLNEVEQFIAENKHLPNVPSAAEVEANGINLGEMNVILLQKVEELTLYIIEQEKQMKEMQKRLSEVEGKKGGE